MTSEDLLQSLREASEAYAALPGLHMVLVTGSVARGLADDSSDLDLYVYVDTVDRRLLEASPLVASPKAIRLFGLTTPDGYFEKYRYGDRLLDVECVEIAALDRVAEQLARPEPPAASSVKLAVGLRDALPLVGTEQLDRWQSRLTYSDGAAASEIAARGSGILAPSALYALAYERGDPLAFTARLSSVLLNTVALLAAANRCFIPVDDPKWLPWHLERLEHLPARFVDRVSAALAQPSPATMGDLDALIADVLDIVDERVPGASTLPARYALRLRPRP